MSFTLRYDESTFAPNHHSLEPLSQVYTDKDESQHSTNLPLLPPIPPINETPDHHFPKQELDESKEKNAALAIQSVFRSHLAQLEVQKERKHTLSDHLFQMAKPYIEDPLKLSSEPRALNGSTPVYMLQAAPQIILKKCHSPSISKSRFQEMQVGREFCQKKNYHFLTIPKAKVCDDVIIEERIPIKHQKICGQMGLYLENQEKMTKPIKELTKLHCQTILTDLVRVNIPRYDNIPQYDEEENGKKIFKIALIDLEGFSLLSAPPTPTHIKRAVKNIIRLFPHHMETILKVGKKYNPEIDKSLQELNKTKNESLSFFKSYYEDHLKFLQKNNISIENPAKSINLTMSQKEELKEKIGKYLLDHFKSKKLNGFENYSENEFSDFLNKFENALPQIFDSIIELIDRKLKNSIEFQGAIISNPDLVSCRNFTIKCSELAQDILSRSPIPVSLNDYQKWDFVKRITSEIFTEFKKTDKIYDFVNHVGTIMIAM